MLAPFEESKGLLDQLGVNPRVLAVQVVIFITTFILLSRILFRRTLDQITQREEEIRTSREAIERDRAEVARLSKDYGTQIARIDREAYEKMQAQVKESISMAQGLVGRAQSESRAEVERAVGEIGREKQRAFEQLQSEIARLTVELAEKVLEAKLDPGAGRAIAEKLASERS